MSALLFYISHVDIGVSADPFDIQGPTFTAEPPHHLEFTNVVDNHVDCVAKGSPTPKIEWLHLDNTPVTTIPRVSTLVRSEWKGANDNVNGPFYGPKGESSRGIGHFYAFGLHGNVIEVISQSINSVKEYYQIERYQMVPVIYFVHSVMTCEKLYEGDYSVHALQ